MSRIKYETNYTETVNDIPAGGTTGQVLRKASDTNYDADWVTVVGTESGFTDLRDTPSSYTGQTGKIVAVNTGEDALEFIEVPSSGGGALQESFELGEDLTINDIVKVVDGKIYKRELCTGKSFFDGVPQEWESTGDSDWFSSIALTSTTFLYTFIDRDNVSTLGANSVVATVCTVNPTTKTITKGAYTQLHAGAIGNGTSAKTVSMGNDLFLNVCRGVNLAGTINRTSIQLFSVVSGVITNIDLEASSTYWLDDLSVVRMTDVSFIVSGNDENNAGQKSFIVGDITSDTISIPASASNLTAVPVSLDVPLVRMSDTQAIAITNTSAGISATPITVTGATSGLEGTPVTIITNANNKLITAVIPHSSSMCTLVFDDYTDYIEYIYPVYFDSTGGTVTDSSILADSSPIKQYQNNKDKTQYIQVSENTYAFIGGSRISNWVNLKIITVDEYKVDPIKTHSQISPLCMKGNSAYASLLSLVGVGGDFYVLDGYSNSDYYDTIELTQYEPILTGSKYGVLTETGSSGETKLVNILGVG